jgi:hypothetical protein
MILIQEACIWCALRCVLSAALKAAFVPPAPPTPTPAPKLLCTHVKSISARGGWTTEGRRDQALRAPYHQTQTRGARATKPPPSSPGNATGKLLKCLTHWYTVAMGKRETGRQAGEPGQRTGPAKAACRTDSPVPELSCPEVTLVLKPVGLEQRRVGGQQHVEQRPRVCVLRARAEEGSGGWGSWGGGGGRGRGWGLRGVESPPCGCFHAHRPRNACGCLLAMPRAPHLLPQVLLRPGQLQVSGCARQRLHQALGEGEPCEELGGQRPPVPRPPALFVVPAGAGLGRGGSLGRWRGGGGGGARAQRSRESRGWEARARVR